MSWWTHLGFIVLLFLVIMAWNARRILFLTFAAALGIATKRQTGDRPAVWLEQIEDLPRWFRLSISDRFEELIGWPGLTFLGFTKSRPVMFHCIWQAVWITDDRRTIVALTTGSMLPGTCQFEAYSYTKEGWTVYTASEGLDLQRVYAASRYQRFEERLSPDELIELHESAYGDLDLVELRRDDPRDHLQELIVRLGEVEGPMSWGPKNPAEPLRKARS